MGSGSSKKKAKEEAERRRAEGGRGYHDDDHRHGGRSHFHQHDTRGPHGRRPRERSESIHSHDDDDKKYCRNCSDHGPRGGAHDYRRPREDPNKMEIPLNFHWIVKKHLCVFQIDARPEHGRWLEKNKITDVFIFKKQIADIRADDVKIHDIDVGSTNAPKEDQIDDFIQIAVRARRNKTAIGFPAHQSKGQIAVLLAAYFMSEEDMSAKEAIEYVETRCKPYRLQSDKQELAVWKYEKYNQQDSRSSRR